MVYFVTPDLGVIHNSASACHYPASAGPLLPNTASRRSSMLVGVKPNFTPTGGTARRKTLIRLSVRLSCGKRSITGQIVVAIQRRLAVASPFAQSAQGKQCN
jgi:hypothetical protein